VPAVAALAETNRRFAHGAITLERIVAGHDGRLTVVEHPLGPAVEALGWPTSRLQSELGLVMPDNRKSNLFDARVDVIQIGFVTLSLLLGRRIDAASYPANVTRLLDESAEAKGGETWAASRVRSWLERALQVGPRPIETIREAMNSLGELPGEGELPRKTAAPAATSAAAAAPPKVEPKPVVPAKPATRLAQVVPAKKVETPHTAAAPSTPPAPPAPAVPVLVARPPAPAPAPAAAPEAPVAPLSVKPPRRFSAASMALAAVSVLALAEGVVLAGRWFIEPKPAAVVEPARPTESASAAVAPEPPKPAPERKAANPPPAAPVDIAPRHEAPPAAPEPAAPAAAVAARRFGGMTIVSPLELQVFEGGTRIGAAGAPIAVLEGVHNIDLVNDALGFRVRETITVKPGELTSRSIAVPNGRVSVNAMPWAEVLIDGNPAGQTPLANLSLSIGEHQFTFRHPQLGEQRQTAVVKSEGVTRLSANMQK
jgi:hypothetical protein